MSEINKPLDRNSGTECETREEKLQQIYSLFDDLTEKELDSLLRIMRTIE